MRAVSRDWVAVNVLPWALETQATTDEAIAKALDVSEAFLVAAESRTEATIQANPGPVGVGPRG